MSTLFFILFFGFIAYRIITSVMGEGFDVSEEARKKLEALRNQSGTSPGQPAQRGVPGRSNLPRPTPANRTGGSQQRQPAPSARTSSSLPRKPAPSRTGNIYAREEDEFDWYIMLDVPADASRREILEAAKRRLEVARSVGDTGAPARIARATAAGMKRFGNAGRGRRQ